MPVPDSLPRHLFQHTPYPPAPAPPTLAHRVWILDCGSCGVFLTNRAMKAVLLLRPNVSLYSSDALPANCSAPAPAPPAPAPSTRHKPRTCECLTQSLCCHGCGNTIGYMIVYPCPRCTASITATNRATNGHRFVFHSNEVAGTERRYIPGEPGVVPFDPPHPAPARRPDLLPTPPLEFATPAFLSAHDAAPQHPNYRTRLVHAPRSPPPLPPLRYASPRLDDDEDDDTDDDGLATPSASPPPPLSPTLSNSSFYPADHKDAEPPLPLPSLRRGDVVFWHHLARSGEISCVTHDERARRPASPPRLPTMLFNR